MQQTQFDFDLFTFEHLHLEHLRNATKTNFDLLCRPQSRNLGKVGFCHCDLWCNNMLKKGDNIIAIDFETASTGIKHVVLVVSVTMLVSVCLCYDINGNSDVSTGREGSKIDKFLKISNGCFQVLKSFHGQI